MEQELTNLRRKVTRLENMILNINDKVGLVLEKFLNHRASQADVFRNMLENEAVICRSLITQLKASSIIGGNRGVTSTPASASRYHYHQNTNRGQAPPGRPTPTPKPLPVCRKSTSQARTIRLQQAHNRVTSRQAQHTQQRAPTTSEATGHANRNNGNQGQRDQQITNFEDDPLSLDGYTASVHAQIGGDLDDNMIIVKPEDIGQELQSEILDMDAGIEVYDVDSSDNEQAPLFSLASGPVQKRRRVRVPSKNPEFWRRRFAKKEYTAMRTFSNEDEAREQIRLEKQWRVNSSQFTLKVKKIYYQCCKDPICPISMYLSVPLKDSNEVTEFVSVGNHMHLSQVGPPRGRPAKKRSDGGWAGINTSLIPDYQP